MKKPMLLVSIATLISSVTQAAVITVNTTNNVNPLPMETSLWQALTNLHDGDTIQFNIPGPGPFYISTPANGYPLLTNNNVLVDGFSQPGSSPNTKSILQPNNARIQIVLDSRAGPEQRTRLASLDNSGYFDWESAILPLRIGLFAYGGGMVTLTVSGGTPPYQLQVRADLAAGGWENLGFTFTNTPVSFSATNPSQSFYRVISQ